MVSFLDEAMDGEKFITLLKNELKGLDGVADADKIKFLEANINSLKKWLNTYSANQVAEIAAQSGFRIVGEPEVAYGGAARVYHLIRK